MIVLFMPHAHPTSAQLQLTYILILLTLSWGQSSPPSSNYLSHLILSLLPASEITAPGLFSRGDFSTSQDSWCRGLPCSTCRASHLSVELHEVSAKPVLKICHIPFESSLFYSTSSPPSTLTLSLYLLEACSVSSRRAENATTVRVSMNT